MASGNISSVSPSGTGRQHVLFCRPEFQRLLLFFPLAGSAGVMSAVSGTYWSGTRNDLFNAGRCSVSAVDASFDGYVSPATGCSVRCVRAREEQAVPCFFPLAGWSGGPVDVVGTMWSCTPDGSGGSTLQVSASSALIGSLQGYFGVSVRCVRAREGQALPRFWIVCFWVL